MRHHLLLAALVSFAFLALPVHAEEMFPKPDDRVMFDVSSEDWVMTKTAHVTVNVESAFSGNNAGTMRSDMVKAVNDVTKADWRLTSFNRSEDQTGLERWSAIFEARLLENQLNNLGEAAKKVSKAGMQLSVGDIDFTPSLEEMESARGALRAQIYKNINEQLASLNSALPGRNYRIGMINFGGNQDGAIPPMPQIIRGRSMLATAGNDATPMMATPAAPMERAEKITLTAHVVFAAAPSVTTTPK